MAIEMFDSSDFSNELSENPSLEEFMNDEGEFVGFEGRLDDLCEELSEYARDAISEDFWLEYSREISGITHEFLTKRFEREDR